MSTIDPSRATPAAPTGGAGLAWRFMSEEPIGRPITARMRLGDGSWWYARVRAWRYEDGDGGRFGDHGYELLHYNGDVTMSRFYGPFDSWCEIDVNLDPSTASPPERAASGSRLPAVEGVTERGDALLSEMAERLCDHLEGSWGYEMSIHSARVAMKLALTGLLGGPERDIALTAVLARLAESRAAADLPPLSDAAAGLPDGLMLRANAIAGAAVPQAAGGDRAVMIGVAVQSMVAALTWGVGPSREAGRVDAGAVREALQTARNALVALRPVVNGASAYLPGLAGRRAACDVAVSAADAALATAGGDGSAGEGWRDIAADAARYRHLREHCSSHYPMTHDQPAEWSISWDFQQTLPEHAFGSFDGWIDQDIARQAKEDAEDDGPAPPTAQPETAK